MREIKKMAQNLFRTEKEQGRNVVTWRLDRRLMAFFFFFNVKEA